MTDFDAPTEARRWLDDLAATEECEWTPGTYASLTALLERCAAAATERERRECEKIARDAEGTWTRQRDAAPKRDRTHFDNMQAVAATIADAIAARKEGSP